tara:strand:- start:3373 stop:5352 length:1980 start_codon:yes stop_codon:yes gene_type:complete
MAKKNYKTDNLYFTDRKKYYEQQESAPKKSIGSDFSNEDYEKMVGFAGSEWVSGGLGRRGTNPLGVNTQLSARFPNLTNGGNLYKNNGGYITISETVYLCQKAWEEFQLFRNTIEAMVEFSMSKIRLSSPNRSAKNFCETWLKSINIDGFSEQFYRELYRSCNVFPYAMKGTISAKDVKDLKMYASTAEIPVKYTVLNPAQVSLYGGLTTDRNFYKVLSPYEIKRLKNPQTQSEKILYQKLSPETKKAIQDSSELSLTSYIYVPLKDVSSAFYQKQDYEYFAAPLFYGVLDDIELKLEMKKADRKVLKTLENMILKVTMGGYKIDGNEVPPNPEHLAYMRELFNNESTQRVLVADYTTEVDYVIPDISKIVGTEKYAQVNEDIREGLQSIFGSNEKFSNQMTKVRVFCQRLKRGQSIFKEWLEGELGNVCKAMGYTKTPKVKLSSINLEDQTSMNRVYTRMAELGFLVPDELNTAIEDGILPEKDESLKNQREYRKFKNDSLYEPQMNYNPIDEDLGPASKDKVKQEPGRPAGTGVPLSEPRQSRVVGGIGGISLKELQSCLIEMDKIKDNVVKKLKSSYKVKKLTDSQVDFANSIAKKVVENYDKAQWEKAVASVIKNKSIDENQEMQEEIDKICDDFELDTFLGALVWHSKREAPSN